MAKRKVRKDMWEQIFGYPSFNRRFGVTFFFFLVLFCLGAYIIFRHGLVTTSSDQIAILNLLVQTATLVLGIFAAFYALRQLVEARFTGLDEAGNQELKRNHYPRAFEKWKEAFYIRPDAVVFLNMCEALLMFSDDETFDEYMRMAERPGFPRNVIFQESSDQLILLYLKAMRHLLVKNQGEAEKHIAVLVTLAKEVGLVGFRWDFMDLRTSKTYQDLPSGECKSIAENLMAYLSGTLQPARKQDFERGNFASQASEPTERQSPTTAAV